MVASLVNYVESFFSVTFSGYRCGWMVLSMYLVFYGWMSYLVVSLGYELGN